MEETLLFPVTLLRLTELAAVPNPLLSCANEMDPAFFPHEPHRRQDECG
jgi:hypothetical protein